MYEPFFGLSARPFADRPDPDFFVESEPHAAALRALCDGLETQQPLLVVTGEAGCGKTMLARALLRRMGEAVTTGVITNPHPAIRDLTRWALLSFGVETTAHSDAELREMLALYLVSEFGAGRRCLLLVDEAQNLTVEALVGLFEYLALNVEGDCLLQVALVGAPRLLQTMRDPGLAAGARTPQICLAGPLAREEVPHYVRARLAIAGAEHEIFTDRALHAVSIASGGVPRLINAICDMALVYAFGRGRDVIDHDVIADVVSEGQAAGFGSLAMLTPVDVDAAAMPEPAEAEPAAVARQEDKSITSAPSIADDFRLRETEPLPSEFFPTELFFEDQAAADIVRPEPAAAHPVTDHAEEPSLPVPSPPPQLHPDLTTGWPSIVGNSRPLALGRAAALRRSPTEGISLRRRFLPRD
jgi:type II secretory pathway predicted ATPase ExeA